MTSELRSSIRPEASKDDRSVRRAATHQPSTAATGGWNVFGSAGPGVNARYTGTSRLPKAKVAASFRTTDSLVRSVDLRPLMKNVPRHSSIPLPTHTTIASVTASEARASARQAPGPQPSTFAIGRVRHPGDLGVELAAAYY
jgi:hypothetical protein